MRFLDRTPSWALLLACSAFCVAAINFVNSSATAGWSAAAAVLVCFVAWAAKGLNLSRLKREQLAAANEAAREAATQELESLSAWTDRQNWPDLNREVSGLILADAERCVALSRGAQHIQLRKRTHYEGRSSSVSVRVMKGVSVRSGGFRGQPVTDVSREVADYGTIFVTDQRFVFAGTREVIEVPLRKLADARASVGTIELLVANRANPLEFGLSEAYRAPVIAGAAKLMAGASHLTRRSRSARPQEPLPPSG